MRQYCLFFFFVNFVCIWRSGGGFRKSFSRSQRDQPFDDTQVFDAYVRVTKRVDSGNNNNEKEVC